jgi:lysophospholipase
LLNAVSPAPFHADIADGPAGGEALWLTTADGVKVRMGIWPCANARGTVLLFPGRTEYIEKYGRAANVLHQHGYAVVSVDWRGQGLAGRLLADRAIGHVGNFTDYQRDVAALVEQVQARGMPQPLYLLAHSMGGCIGLRALIDGLAVKAVAFSAPMWGVHLARALRPVAWSVSTLGSQFGFGDMLVPGRSTENYVQQTTLAENGLTTDPDMLDYMREQLDACPDLGLGGPSLHWLNEALREMRKLSVMPAPRVPCLTFLGTNETIVDSARIRQRMSNWPDGHLTILQGARHEAIMEAPAIRKKFFDGVIAHFAAHP